MIALRESTCQESCFGCASVHQMELIFIIYSRTLTLIFIHCVLLKQFDSKVLSVRKTYQLLCGKQRRKYDEKTNRILH